MNEIDLSHAMGVFDQIEQTLSDVKKHMLADNHQKQNVEEKRIKFIFSEKPSPLVVQLLKKRAFKYSPKKNEWIRLWTYNAAAAACVLRAEIKKTIGEVKLGQAIDLSNREAAE